MNDVAQQVVSTAAERWDRERLRKAYWFAALALVVLPFVGVSFSGPRWGLLQSVVLGVGLMVIAVVPLILAFVVMPGSVLRRTIAGVVVAVLHIAGRVLTMPLEARLALWAVGVTSVAAAWFFVRRYPVASYAALLLAPPTFIGLTYAFGGLITLVTVPEHPGVTQIVYSLALVLTSTIPIVLSVLVGGAIVRLRSRPRISTSTTQTEEIHG